jgi:hypothetical protein
MIVLYIAKWTTEMKQIPYVYKSGDVIFPATMTVIASVRLGRF